MITNFAILSGLLAAMLHVVAGVDHLATVTPLVVETRLKSWLIGFWWGLGHTIGILIIGTLFLFFKDYIPIAYISNYSEQLVAFILIGIGIWGFYRIYHAPRKTESVKEQTHISSVGIGVVHGLASVSHFILLLPALSFESNFETVQYVAGFCIGTMLAMGLYTFMVGKLVNHFKVAYPYPQTLNRIRFWSGLFACSAGVFLLFYHPS